MAAQWEDQLVIEWEFDVKKFERELEQYRQEALKVLAQGMHMLAETGMALSKDDYVPVLTGYLRSTGYVGDVDWEGSDRAVINVGYSASYALARHETGRDRTGYLVEPFMLVAQGAQDRLERYLSERLANIAR